MPDSWQTFLSYFCTINLLPEGGVDLAGGNIPGGKSGAELRIGKWGPKWSGEREGGCGKKRKRAPGEILPGSPYQKAGLTAAFIFCGDRAQRAQLRQSEPAR